MMNIRALKLGFRIAEVPSYEHARIHGIGRLRTFPDGWRVLKTIFAETRAASRRAPGPTVVRHALPVEDGLALRSARPTGRARDAA